MSTHRLFVAILCACACLSIGGTAAASAQAAYVSSNSGGAYIRSQPSPGAGFYDYAGNGTSLMIYCYTDAAWANGNYSSNRWFQVAVPSYQYGSPEAYIHASLVADQPTVRHC